MKKNLFLLILLLFPYVSYAEQVAIPECVQYRGYSKAGNGDIILQFFSNCYQKVTIFVCVTEQSGKQKFYTSFGRVSPYGSFSLRLDTPWTPRSIAFASDLVNPNFTCQGVGKG